MSVPRRPEPRPQLPDPQLKPDSRLSRMAALTERKMQLEVELLELQVGQARGAAPIHEGHTCSATVGDGLICIKPADHVGEHLCSCNAMWEEV